jgi:uncharacterized protein YlxW (UPF0749 family)
MALITAVWIAGYVVQKSISTAVSFAWSAVSSTKQGQEAYEERKQRLALLTASQAASQASAAETAQLRAEVRRLQAVVERLEAADRERYDLVIDQR